MGELRKLLRNSQKIQEFRQKYEISDDVQFRLNGLDDLGEYEQTREKFHIPLLYVVEGSIQFPLEPFFREVCSKCSLNLMQLCLKFVRVVMGVVALNHLLNLELN